MKETIIQFFISIFKYVFLMPLFIAIGIVRSIYDFFKYDFSRFLYIDGRRIKRIIVMAFKPDNSNLIKTIKSGWEYDYIDTLKDILFGIIKNIVPKLVKSHYTNIEDYKRELGHEPDVFDLNKINGLKELIDAYDWITITRNDLYNYYIHTDNWKEAAEYTIKLMPYPKDQMEKQIKAYIEFNERVIKDTKNKNIKLSLKEDIINDYLDAQDQQQLIKIVKNRHLLWD